MKLDESAAKYKQKRKFSFKKGAKTNFSYQGGLNV